MRQNHFGMDMQRAVRYVKDRTEIVKIQKQQIGLLKARGASTARAEVALAKTERNLLHMQNHLQILQALHQRNYDPQ